MSNTVPLHVPAELVRDFNIFDSPGMLPSAGGCPFKSLLADVQGFPPIFYVPQSGRMRDGNWVLTRAEDMRRVFQDPETFSSKAIAGFSHLMGESWDLIPLETDPPVHAKYRAVLDPALTARRIEDLAPQIRRLAVELIDKVRGSSGCDFVSSFAQPFPVGIFLSLFGLPHSDFDQFMSWSWNLLHHQDMGERARAAVEMRDYLRVAMAARDRNPTDDILGTIVRTEIDGRPLSDEEKMGYAFMLFIGGLDTVASSLGFYFRYLAENPEMQQRLRDDPALIPSAVEELLRAYSVVTTSRRVTKDTVLNGVSMKAGDWVSITMALANHDPAVVKDPEQIRFDRTPNPHFTFATGRHRCMGSNLARREMAIALEEWTQRMPAFRLASGSQPLVHGGGVFGVKELQLVWG